MNTAGRVYVLSAAIALVAMASRVGWIDWPVVGRLVAAGLVMLTGSPIALVLVWLTVFAGPLVLLLRRKANPEKPVEAPTP